jgi:hypothetical protein
LFSSVSSVAASTLVTVATVFALSIKNFSVGFVTCFSCLMLSSYDLVAANISSLTFAYSSSPFALSAFATAF